MALDELARVQLHELLLGVYALQILEADAMNMFDRLDCSLPLRLRQRNAVDAPIRWAHPLRAAAARAE